MTARLLADTSRISNSRLMLILLPALRQASFFIPTTKKTELLRSVMKLRLTPAALVGANEVKTAAHGDNEWFTYYIKVDGKKVTVKVNGKTVNEYTEPANVEGAARLRHGTIGIESSGAGSRVKFRNPMIRLLPN